MRLEQVAGYVIHWCKLDTVAFGDLVVVTVIVHHFQCIVDRVLM